jgi:hypothetical protein
MQLSFVCSVGDTLSRHMKPMLTRQASTWWRKSVLKAGEVALNVPKRHRPHTVMKTGGSWRAPRIHTRAHAHTHMRIASETQSSCSDRRGCVEVLRCMSASFLEKWRGNFGGHFYIVTFHMNCQFCLPGWPGALWHLLGWCLVTNCYKQ